MRGLTALVTRAAAADLRAALTMAAAAAALGGRARVFVDEAAVGLLCTPLSAPDDAERTAAGLPTLAATWDTAREVGVTLIACQTGLALAGLTATALPPECALGGLVGLVADLGDDRLVTI